MTDNTKPSYRYQHLLRQDCPLPPGTHVCVYCRDSGGDEQDRSVQQQIEAASEYCNRFELLIDRIYFDEAEKATAIEKRDDFAAMLADLRQQFPVIYDPNKREQRTHDHPYGVICWKSNRLGRDLIHTRNVKSDLRLRGIAIVSLISNFETGNASLDALIESFYEYQDEILLKEISDNARRGLAELVTKRDNDPDFLAHNPGWPSTGAYLGIMPGKIPLGFKAERITVGTYKRKNGKRSGELREVQRMVPDPELWERCKLAWKMRHEGASFADIHHATRLYKTTANYNVFFSNLIYTGTLDYGGQRFENFVPAMVPMEWWKEEEEKRAERNKKRIGQPVDPQLEPRRVGASSHLLSGLLFCAHVAGEEHPMYGDFIPAKQGVRRRWDYYICSVKKNSHGIRCDAPRIGAKLLEKAVIDGLMTNVLTRDHLRPLADAIAREFMTANSDATVRLQATQLRYDEVERQIDNLINAIEEMGLSPSLKAKLNDREAEKERLELELNRLRLLATDDEDVPAITNAAIDHWIAHIRAALTGSDIRVSRRAIQQFVSKVIVTKEGGDIIYTLPFDGRALRLGNEQVPLRSIVPSPSLIQHFSIPQSKTITYLERYPDRNALRDMILAMRVKKLSFRQIGRILNLHWTRVSQIARQSDEN